MLLIVQMIPYVYINPSDSFKFNINPLAHSCIYSHGNNVVLYATVLAMNINRTNITRYMYLDN